MMHFSRPEGNFGCNSAYASIQSNTYIVAGVPETKPIKDLLPDIIQQLGPKQHQVLKDLVSSTEQVQGGDDAPDLVGTTEEKLDQVE